jgi:hypothetical protein
MHPHGSPPRARKDGLLEETVGEELLLYDRDSHTAHCLSPVAACVWRHCDGERDMTELAELAGATESLVADALHELREKDLLAAEPPLMQSTVSGISRREAIVRVARVGAAAAAAPLIVSATAATPAMASSGEGEGKIHATPEVVKFIGKVSHIITIKNEGTGNAKLITEFTSFEEAYKITKKCAEVTLEPKQSCEVTIEHTNTIKGQAATWWLEWNGGGFNEKSHVLLESN